MDFEIQFKVLSNDIISNSSIVIDSIKSTKIGTVKDMKLGEIHNTPCNTCFETKLSGCNGHFGKCFMNNVILYNPAFINILNNLLKQYCYFCGSIKNPELIKIAIEYDKTKLNSLKKQFNNLLTEKINKCYNINCNSPKSSFKINKDGKIYVKKIEKNNENKMEVCDIHLIYDMISNTPIEFIKLVTNSDLNDVTFNDLFFHNNFYIASNYIREPNFYENNENHALTSNLNSIVSILIKPVSKEIELQKLINSIDNCKGISAYKRNINLITLAEQVNGTNKEGILRQYIVGRRLDKTSRCVLGPAESLNIGEIYIPKLVLMNQTDRIYYNRLTHSFIYNLINNISNPYNLKLRMIVFDKNYGSVYPSNIMVIRENKKFDFVHKFKFGDFIEVEKPEGSMITFNRTPSLHKWNIQAAKVRMIETNTIKTPICIQTSQNADNDGDEVNTTNPNNPASILELACLMNSKAISKNSGNNSTIYGLVQDQLIAIYNLYRLKEIPKKIAYGILGKYLPYINNLNKDEYSGQEILSLFLPEHLTYKPYFDDGKIILNNIIIQYLIAQSYQSIFNIISQLISPYYSVELINIYKYIAQRYLNIYGYSIKTSNVIIPNSNKLIQNNDFVLEYVKKINDKITQFINDIKNKKTISFTHNDIEYIKQKNIDNLNQVVLEKIDKEPIIESPLNDMTNTGYKRTKGEILKSEYFFGQQGNIQIPTINGRMLNYYLPGSIGLSETGFVSSSLLKGMNFIEYINHVRLESIPNIINVTCGTATTGYMGKKLIKFMGDNVVNYQGSVVNFNEMIIPFANFLKISGSDICKVKIITPNKNQYWYNHILKLYNSIKPYLIYNLHSEMIEYLIFYINIEGDIDTFNNTYNYKKINEKIAYDLILEFYNEIIRINYYYIQETEGILYILLTYFDPNRTYLSRELLNYIFNKIKLVIRYSLSAGTVIGYDYGHTIQENFTQQTLSSFHTSTKAGKIIIKGSTNVFRECVNLSIKNKPDLVTCYSTDYSKIIKIKNIFEYTNLYMFKPIYTVLENDFPKHVVKISIIRTAINLKHITINQYIMMYNNVLSKFNFISNYWLTVNLTETNIDVIIGVTFYEKYEVSVIKLKYSLFVYISKGKAINKNLEIITQNKYNSNYELEKFYEISFFISEPSELIIIDTENVNVELGIWHSYEIAGIFHSKITALNKMIEISGDLQLYNPYFLLTSLMFSNSIPISIHKLREKKSIIKNVIHGENEGFIKAAFHNTIDPCDDVYSNIMIGSKMKYGTGYFNSFLNPNIYKQFETEITNKIENIDQLNLISDFN